MIVDCAVYVGGVRTAAEPLAIADAVGKLTELNATRHRAPVHDLADPDDEQFGAPFAWLGLVDPDETELTAAAAAIGCEPRLLRAGLNNASRPRIDLEDDALTIILKTATYHDDTETVAIGQVSLYLTDHFVTVIRHEVGPDFRTLRERLEAHPTILAQGPHAVMHGVILEVVERYNPVIDGIENDIGEVEAQVFGAPDSEINRRIYLLLREALELHRAVLPLSNSLKRAIENPTLELPSGLRPYYRDALSSVEDIVERIASARNLMESALSANLTQVSVRQNEDMRRISAWGAIVAVPTLVAGIYGMNFKYMPELTMHWAYPVVLLAMGVVCFILFRVFRRYKWL